MLCGVLSPCQVFWNSHWLVLHCIASSTVPYVSGVNRFFFPISAACIHRDMSLELFGCHVMSPARVQTRVVTGILSLISKERSDVNSTHPLCIRLWAHLLTISSSIDYKLIYWVLHVQCTCMSSSVDHTHYYLTEGVLVVHVCRCGESVDRLLLKNLLSMLVDLRVR